MARYKHFRLLSRSKSPSNKSTGLEVNQNDRHRLHREVSNQSTGLLKLPTELRSIIYDCIVIWANQNVETIKLDPFLHLEQLSTPLALTHLCRQIRHDVLPIYVERNIPVFSLSDPVTAGRLLAPLLPEWALHSVRRFEVQSCYRWKPARIRYESYLLAPVLVDRQSGTVSTEDPTSWRRCDSKAFNITRIQTRNHHWTIEWGRHVQRCGRCAHDVMTGKMMEEIECLGLQRKDRELKRHDFELLSKRMKRIVKMRRFTWVKLWG